MAFLGVFDISMAEIEFDKLRHYSKYGAEISISNNNNKKSFHIDFLVNKQAGVWGKIWTMNATVTIISSI